MTEIFQELIKETISKIERLESRSRRRSAKAQISFNHAVKLLSLIYGKPRTAYQSENVQSINVVGTTLKTHDTVIPF